MLKKLIKKRRSIIKSVEKFVFVFILTKSSSAVADPLKVERSYSNTLDQNEEKTANEKTQKNRIPGSKAEKFLFISRSVEIYANILGEIGKQYFYNFNYEEANKKTIKVLQESMDKGTEILIRGEKNIKKTNEIEKTLLFGFDVEERKALKNIKEKKEREEKTFYSGIFCKKIYKDSPASKSGLQKGDLIIKLGTIDVLNKSEDEFINIIKNLSVPFDMTIVKLTGEIKKIFIGKEKIKERNIIYTDILEGEIGYIKIEEFGIGVSQEFKQALGNLKSLGASKILIDLRGNYGGLVDELIQTVEQLIEPETIVLKIASRSGEIQKTYKAKGEIYDRKTPIIVLVDQETASAAEIFAGVLQDLDRAIIIGKPTYGKGTIQTIRELPYGYAIKLTTSRYILPSGRYVLEDISNRPSRPFKSRQFRTKKGRLIYELKGITPDIVLTDKSLSPIISESLKNGAFDQYANEFISKKEIKSINGFHLSENQIAEAIVWLANHKEFYKHEQELEKLFSVLNEYGYVEVVKTNQQKIRNQMQKERVLRLNEYKKEVKEILENSIIENKFFYEGLIEFTIKKDQKIQRAISILKKMEEYERMLSV